MPQGGIVNVALTDLTSLSVNPKTSYLMSEVNKTRVVSSLLGGTTVATSHVPPYGKFASPHFPMAGTGSLQFFQRFTASALYISSRSRVTDGLTFGTN